MLLEALWNGEALCGSKCKAKHKHTFLRSGRSFLLRKVKSTVANPPNSLHTEMRTRLKVTSFCKMTILAAAAAAKSLQSCPTLCDPIDGSPPGSPIPGILQARTLEWVAISFSNA